MAISTIPGVQQSQFPVNVPGQGATDLSSLFAKSFSNLMGVTDAEDASESSTLTLRDQFTTLDSTTLGGQDTISAAGDGVALANGQLSLGGTLSFLGGVGANTRAAADNATIFGTANSVYHYARQDTVGQTLFLSDGTSSGLKPENILFDASTSHQSLQAYAGVGDTIKGGTASDTITVHNTVSGTQGGATLSGGSGSSNLFQFLNNKGGSYTISDFSKAAGNKIGLKASDEQLGKMLDNQTVNGGNVTLDLPNDQGQITFLDQTKLHAKDFQKF